VIEQGTMEEVVEMVAYTRIRDRETRS